MSWLTQPRATLAENYRKVRSESEKICSYLSVDDYQLQSIVETSPPKWHLAHVSWFFETFVLPQYQQNYSPFDSKFAYLFNSYYQTVGAMHPRPHRGVLSRPTVEEIYQYRAYVDEHMLSLIEGINESEWDKFFFRVTLGLNHEQQHQELLLMDIKHNFSVNPLKPEYRSDLQNYDAEIVEMKWLECEAGVYEIGNDAENFCFDNETPRHEVLVRDHKLATRLVTNAEFLEFIEDKGYQRPELWLADGWHQIQQKQNHHPLYWEQINGDWQEFTLAGMRKLNPNQPVCHLDFYEASAFANWAGKRLPLEEELELQLAARPVEGNFVDKNFLHPQAGDGQWFGDVWEWTASPYGSYPGFKPLEGSMGEYNGKFMCNQMTLRGGCCATPLNHMRASYRNFFYPHDRWAFTGLRLAEDIL